MKNLLALFLAASTLPAAVTYGHLHTRWFDDPNTRSNQQSNPLTPATNSTLPLNYSTAGPNPVVLTGSTNIQGSPFLMNLSLDVNAGSSTTLDQQPYGSGPVFGIAGVQTSIEDDILITGSTGTGYLIPTFRVTGSFNDSASNLRGYVQGAAGINSFTIPDLANSDSSSTFDVLFSPAIGTHTDFTFGTPFSIYMGFQLQIWSMSLGTVTPGQMSGQAQVQFLGMQVVDANGDPIRGAVIQSGFLDVVNSPEPASFLYLAPALAAFAVRLRRRKPSQQ